MFSSSLSKRQWQVILIVTIANILEWYDIYLYAYLSPILAEVFYDPANAQDNLIKIFLIFGMAFLIRPFGGIIFGRLGDLIGRKASFQWSVIIITIPTFAIGCLPGYSQIGIYAPWLLAICRLLQAIPSAGEVPGTMCFLYEYSNQYPGQKNERFMTSWSGVGNQIGAILALVEMFFMHSYLSHDFMLMWGWRISFWSAGIIGLISIFLRRKLHETPVFTKVKRHHNLDTERFFLILKHYKKQILLTTGFGAISASTFYLSATYLPTFLGDLLGLTFAQNILMTSSSLILSTAILPLIGVLGDKWNNKMILSISIVVIIISLYPLYLSVQARSGFFILLIGFVYLITTSCITRAI